MAIILRAPVLRPDQAKAINWLGTIVDGWPERVKRLPIPKTVAISQEPDGIFLLRFTETGTCFADTWHRSIDEAKSQALSELGVREEDWVATGP